MTTGVLRNPKNIRWVIIDTSGNVTTDATLEMLINPTNLDFSYNQIINETRTMGGFLQEFWGEQLTTASGSGETALFYDPSAGLTNSNNKSSGTAASQF